MNTHEVVLATTVDGGRGALCVDSMPSQGVHIIPPKLVDKNLRHFSRWQKMKENLKRKVSQYESFQIYGFGPKEERKCFL